MGSTTRFLILLTTTTTATPSLLLRHRCPSLLRLTRHRHRLPPSLSLQSHHHRRHLSSSPAPIFFLTKSRPLHTQTASSYHGASPAPPTLSHHPWPEFSALLDNLSAAGYFNGLAIPDELFVGSANFPEEFVTAANACLSFANDRWNLLGMVSRRDVEVVVQNGSPFLFKNGEESARRMRLFLDCTQSNMVGTDKANTVDLMRFLLSYASTVTVSFEVNNPCNRGLVESSVRNLLFELAKLSCSTLESNISGSVQSQFPDKYEQPITRPYGQNIEMKRGDWICPRCNFMNFARNVKCLECEEVRPKRQLTGREWECPQCDFFNYGRNMVCLRCDCNRPGEAPFGTTISGSGDSRYGNGSYVNKADIDSRLAANEEKAQRWFSKVSQLDSSSDISSEIADEDFPEIMPLRKGVNKFVVSTRKTPLERRLANAQYQRNLGNDFPPEGNDLQADVTSNSLNTTANRSLDEILGRSSSVSESNSIANGQNTAPSNAASTQSRGINSNNVPFVPLPADMFAKKPDNSVMEGEKTVSDYPAVSSDTAEGTGAISGGNDYGYSEDKLQSPEKPMNQNEDKNKEKEQAEKSDRWFKRVAELHNVKDLPSVISDEDFPEIMPMRKGENKFVVSKKKDRPLTSPTYKRSMATEQTNNNNFVPFVPFPPDYFAKKDNRQPEGSDLTTKASGESSNSARPENLPENFDDARHKVFDRNHVQQMENQQISSGSWNSKPSGEDSNEIRTDAAYMAPTMRNATQNFTDPERSGQGSSSGGYSGRGNRNDPMTQRGNSPQPSDSQNTINRWVGKSLEGSAVKEPDPLDMSEEAKSERWFRRVAQIKDISELSQIPDEDFPSIMPMRKGVNRFVVSKRKTPMERRLTSQQYRRNLPIITSDPMKKGSDND
ncbi:zf-RanBP domain-containing protein [Cephalotus follicularis]|uniref:Zf-RanBP domain-containing protein n=1 Tax=Cephalotus follicularis TaxID=3775 RepID=A0A1Q3C9I6_CEPFO|nr:zf-RanBP domain-containing protein [Cephalotus follicularis]